MGKSGGMLDSMTPVSDDAIAEALAQQIAADPQFLLEGDDDAARTYIANKLADMIKTQRNLAPRKEGQKKTRYVKRSNKNLKGFADAIYRTLKSENPKIEIPKTYRKDLKASLELARAGDDGIAWTLEVPEFEKPRDAFFSYYPYFRLTAEQKKEALDVSNGIGKEKWTQFKTHIKETVARAIDSSKVEAALEYFGPSAFIKNDVAGVQGVLGEL